MFLYLHMLHVLWGSVYFMQAYGRVPGVAVGVKVGVMCWGQLWVMYDP